MIFVIVPLGKEAKDVTDWIARVIMYTAGTTVGAALLALALGLVGQGVGLVLGAIGLGSVGPQLTVGVLGVAALMFALHELNIIRLPAPQIGWQVPKSWMAPSRLFGNTAYGIAL